MTKERLNVILVLFSPPLTEIFSIQSSKSTVTELLDTSKSFTVHTKPAGTGDIFFFYVMAGDFSTVSQFVKSNKFILDEFWLTPASPVGFISTESLGWTSWCTGPELAQIVFPRQCCHISNDVKKE